MKRDNIAVTMLPLKWLEARVKCSQPFDLSVKIQSLEIADNYFLRASVITAQSITTKVNNPSYVTYLTEHAPYENDYR